MDSLAKGPWAQVEANLRLSSGWSEATEMHWFRRA